MAAMFKVIANNHRVTPGQVLQSLVNRRASLDFAVIVAFAVLYGFAASALARRISRRYPFHEGWFASVVITVFASAVFSTAGVLLGEIWSLVAESFRVGNGHLSYRVERIPWNQHRLGLFIGGVVLFWLITGLHYRLGVRGAEYVRP